MARRRGNRWQGDVLQEGQRIRKSFKTEAEALLWERSFETERGGSGRGQEPEVVAALTVSKGRSQSLRAFLRDNSKFLWGSQANPAKGVQPHLNELEDIVGQDAPLSTFDYAFLLDLVAMYEERGNSAATINRKMATVSKLLKHAVKLNQLPAMPEIPRFREDNGRIRFLTKDEERRIGDYFRGRNYLGSYHLTNMLLYTGARRGELHSLQHRDVSEDGTMVSFWKTKAKTPRSIPITPPVAEAIKWFSEQHDGTTIVNVPYYRYTRDWLKAKRDLGYEKDDQFVPHCLRHTCASRLVQRGIDLRRVQTFMGHLSINTTIRYAHLAPGDLKSAADALL